MNKKFILISVMSLLFNFFVFSEEINIQEELLNYINKDLKSIATLEATAIDAYSSVTGANFKDDKTMYDAMVQIVIPNYALMNEKLEIISLSLKAKEVKALNDIYVAAANIQNNAFNLILVGLEKGDTNIVLIANRKLDRARRLLSEWKQELYELCEQYGVTLNN